MVDLSNNDLFRGLILYGLNTATYKLAVAQLITEYAKEGRDIISLDDMSYDFYSMYYSRLNENNFRPQINISGRKTVVTSEIIRLNNDMTTENKALKNIKQKALYEMVLPKFHNIGSTKSPVVFYKFDKENLTLTKSLLDLFDTNNSDNYLSEINSRWDLLESAFESIHTKKPMESHYIDLENKLIKRGYDRTNITSAIGALKGYQQNRCFYCGENLYLPIHVDHVIPRSIVNHDEIWNLVLTHAYCNQSKSDNLVGKYFIENLIDRNEGLIKSNHPLKERLIFELGSTYVNRKKKTYDQYELAKRKIDRYWRHEKYNPQEDIFYRKFISALRNNNLSSIYRPW